MPSEAKRPIKELKQCVTERSRDSHAGSVGPRQTWITAVTACPADAGNSIGRTDT